MAAPSAVVKGKAVIEGVAGSFDAILYAIQQTGKATQNWEEEIIKDVHGYDIAWVARNEHLTCDWSLKLVADTVAHLASIATAVTGPPAAAVSALGQPLLAPISAVTFTATAPTCACFTGAYQIVSGGGVDLGNTKVGDLDLKLRRYANSDQATASLLTPV